MKSWPGNEAGWSALLWYLKEFQPMRRLYFYTTEVSDLSARIYLLPSLGTLPEESGSAGGQHSAWQNTWSGRYVHHDHRLGFLASLCTYCSCHWPQCRSCTRGVVCIYNGHHGRNTRCIFQPACKGLGRWWEGEGGRRVGSGEEWGKKGGGGGGGGGEGKGEGRGRGGVGEEGVGGEGDWECFRRKRREGDTKGQGMEGGGVWGRRHLNPHCPYNCSGVLRPG